LQSLGFEFGDAPTSIILSNDPLDDQVNVVLAFALDPRPLRPDMPEPQQPHRSKADKRCRGLLFLLWVFRVFYSGFVDGMNA
jgi:hypothetical protein